MGTQESKELDVDQDRYRIMIKPKEQNVYRDKCRILIIYTTPVGTDNSEAGRRTSAKHALMLGGYLSACRLSWMQKQGFEGEGVSSDEIRGIDYGKPMLLHRFLVKGGEGYAGSETILKTEIIVPMMYSWEYREVFFDRYRPDILFQMMDENYVDSKAKSAFDIMNLGMMKESLFLEKRYNVKPKICTPTWNDEGTLEDVKDWIYNSTFMDYLHNRRSNGDFLRNISRYYWKDDDDRDCEWHLDTELKHLSAKPMYRL